MKVKKKINYGWIFMLICLIILSSCFFIKNHQMNQEKNSLLESSNQYYKMMTDAFTLNSSEVEMLKKIPADAEKEIKSFAEKTAQDHWAAIASQITPLFIDQQTCERHAKAFQDLFIANIENQLILMNVEISTDEKPTFSWNLLNEIKIMSYYRLTCKFDDQLSNEFSKNATTQYANDEIIWEKTENGFKISKAGWLVKQSIDGFYKSY